MFKLKNKTYRYGLCIVLTFMGFAWAWTPSSVYADPAPGQFGDQQNAECVAKGGVLGYDSATSQNTCTTCDGGGACITNSSNDGKVLPLYYPAACKAAGGNYSGTVSSGSIVSCKKPDGSIMDIKLKPGALPMPSGVNQDNSRAGGTLKASCVDTNRNGTLDKNECGIIAYIIKFINVLSAAVGIIIVAVITFRGVQYTFSRDNAQETAKAKDGVRDAVFAVVYYIFIVAFLQWIVPGGVF